MTATAMSEHEALREAAERERDDALQALRWCRPRLSCEAYRKTLDKRISLGPAPQRDEPRLVQSEAALSPSPAAQAGTVTDALVDVTEDVQYALSVFVSIREYCSQDRLDRKLNAVSALGVDAAILKLQSTLSLPAEAPVPTATERAQAGGVAEVRDDREVEDIERLASSHSVLHWGGILRIISRMRKAEAALPPSPAAQAGTVTEALRWYAENVEGCRKVGSPGDPFRHALDRDGGKRVRAALEAALPVPGAGAEAGGWMPTSGAARDVLAERARQIEAEGWTPEHDDAHDKGEMADAAACYALGTEKVRGHHLWPWNWTWWKPTNRRRDLVKSGALILAEIERIDRLPPPPASDGEGR